MFRIELESNGSRKVFRLSGRLLQEHVGLLRAEIEGAKVPVTLNLEEVTTIGPVVLRLLMDYERSGVILLNCSMYVREWLDREGEK
jgi:hypothetical protein